MPSDNQPDGFLNRAIVTLFLVFTIPASLTIAGMYFVAIQGRVPGGEDSFCERAISDELSVRIDIYTYQAGLVEFETQTFSVRYDTDGWRELFSDTIPAARSVNCDTSIESLSANQYVLHNQKTIAWSTDRGFTWQIHNVCDPPRPRSERCDAEGLNFAHTNFTASGEGELLIQATVVDEFGEPQRDENNVPVVADEWLLTTTDAGQSWQIQVNP